MPFKEIPGTNGKLFVPDTAGEAKKHPCPDCFHCQWCSNRRCEACRAAKKKKMP